MRGRRGGEPWWRAALALVAVAALIATLAALALHQFSWPWQWAIVLAALSHYAMWAAPVALAGALFARRPLVGGLGAVCCVVVLAIQLPPLPASPPTRDTEIPVLQANLEVGSADPAALVDLVRRHHVQILATEELTFAAQRRLVAAGLPKLLPHRFTAPLPGGGGGIGIWSRHPLRTRHNLRGYQLGVLTARTFASGRAVIVVAVHLLPPYPYPAGTWRSEIVRLHGLLARLPAGPVIVPGDFNATVDHDQFRALLDGGFGDAALDSGAGYLRTYPTDRWYPPLLGIDHVLSRGLWAEAARTYDLPGSDHRALLVRLAASP